MKHKLLTVGIAGLLPILSMTGQIIYPSAPSDNTTDNYFGIKVADPYRPLENDTAANTLQWVNAENAVTRSYLDAIPFRKDIHARLSKLNNYRKEGLPSKENDGRYYFYLNDGLQNQSVLYRKATLDGAPEVFINPNTLSDDGTVALTGVYQSHDGKYTAYTISRSGSDWTEIFVIDTETKQPLADHIKWAKFTGAVWKGDGFYYSAYDMPEEGKEYSNTNEYNKVYYHRLGTPQSEDILIYQNLNEPLKFHRAYVPKDESILAIFGSGQGNGESLEIMSLKDKDAKFVVVEPSQDYQIELLGMNNGMLYALTTVDAPKYRIVAIDPANPAKENWKTIVPESDAVIASATFAGDGLITVYNKDASHKAFYSNVDGSSPREIPLPGYGTVSFSADKGNPEIFYSLTSFTNPSAKYIYDAVTGKSTLISQTAIEGFNPDDYVTEQVFYTSKDGTKVPMFIVYKKGLKKDGSNPVYLYGYGGFNIALYPSFNANRLAWLEQGGIYAQANLRGGSEYGESWHEAGTKLQKLNVFDDFISAGEYMIEQGWTKPELLTIEGGSNGGLLVGACTNMRPDLFRVAIPRVGVMDMMRYHLFTIGWNWAHDYGTSADSPEMARYLLDYSPIHNIRNDGTPYPSIMVTTADHDDRVVPAHSFKYAAALQAADTGNNPKLIRIDSKAGHGAGKPVAKVIDEWADIYSFVLKNLGREPKY